MQEIAARAGRAPTNRCTHATVHAAVRGVATCSQRQRPMRPFLRPRPHPPAQRAARARVVVWGRCGWSPALPGRRQAGRLRRQLCSWARRRRRRRWRARHRVQAAAPGAGECAAVQAASLLGRRQQAWSSPASMSGCLAATEAPHRTPLHTHAAAACPGGRGAGWKRRQPRGRRGADLGCAPCARGRLRRAHAARGRRRRHDQQQRREQWRGRRQRRRRGQRRQSSCGGRAADGRGGGGGASARGGRGPRSKR